MGRWPAAVVKQVRVVEDVDTYRQFQRECRDKATNPTLIAQAWALKDASVRGASLAEVDATIDGVLWTITIDVDRQVVLAASPR